MITFLIAEDENKIKETLSQMLKQGAILYLPADRARFIKRSWKK